MAEGLLFSSARPPSPLSPFSSPFLFQTFFPPPTTPKQSNFSSIRWLWQTARCGRRGHVYSTPFFVSVPRRHSSPRLPPKSIFPLGIKGGTACSTAAGTHEGTRGRRGPSFYVRQAFFIGKSNIWYKLGQRKRCEFRSDLCCINVNIFCPCEVSPCSNIMIYFILTLSPWAT